jgi:hypothetical protein
MIGIGVERFVKVAVAEDYIWSICTDMLDYPDIVQVKYERVAELSFLQPSTTPI